MNAWFDSAETLWRLAGWTMLHFLWAGTVVALLGAAVRWACRRGSADVRYAASLGTLVLLAATPVGLASWLAVSAQIPEFRRNSAPVGEFLRNSQSAEADVATEEERAANGDATGANPSPSPSLRGRGDVAPLARLVGWLPVVWLAGAPLTFALLAAGLVGSRRLQRGSMPLVDGPIVDACRRLERVLGVARRAAVAVCDGIAQPVLVGLVKPTILLPAAAITGWTPEELEMALVHELAHVRRWDNLVNLGQRVIESLLFFHPAVWLVSRQVRRDREECCDALVIRQTRRPEAYAALLVKVAAAVRGPGGRAPRLAGATALADHPLAGRVRRILKLEDEPMWVSRRTLALLVVLALGLTSAVYRAAFAQPTAIAGAAIDDAASGPADEKPLLRVYSVGDVDAVDFIAWLRLMESNKHKVEIGWHEDSKGMIVKAPERFHAKIAEFLDRSRTRRKVAEGLGYKIRSLRAELLKLQEQLLDIEGELNEIEVNKVVALQNANSPRAMNAAVKEALDRDPTIAMYQERLFVLHQQIAQLAAGNRDPENAQLRRLQAQAMQTEAAMAKYRAKEEKEIRDRLRNVPNEALRAAIAEYTVRKEFLKKSKAEIERKISEVEARLLELAEGAKSQTPSDEEDENKDDHAANAKEAERRVFAESLKLLEQAERGEVSALMMLDLSKSEAVAKVLFQPSESNPLEYVNYDVSELETYPDAVESALEGLASDPYGPHLPIDCSRLDDNRLRVEATSAGHRVLRLMFAEWRKRIANDADRAAAAQDGMDREELVGVLAEAKRELERKLTRLEALENERPFRFMPERDDPQMEMLQADIESQQELLRDLELKVREWKNADGAEE